MENKVHVAMLGLLKKMEWGSLHRRQLGNHTTYRPCCPICGCYEKNPEGHEKECELYNLITILAEEI